MADPRTARVVLGLPGGKLELELEVTSGPASVDQLLPLARSLTEQIVELTVIQVEEQGRKILPRGVWRLLPATRAHRRSRGSRGSRPGRITS